MNMKWRELALDEFLGIKNKMLIWSTLAWQDIKFRYRRSYLGPFWLTISMMIYIYSLGFLYGHLFKMKLAIYLPYLAAGIIGWTFISTVILESANAYIESESYIRNQDIALSVFNMRLVLRNLIVFFHNLVAYIPIVIIFHVSIRISTLLLFPSLFIIGLNGILWGSIFGILGTRYRDFYQILGSLMQVIFFLTPIMWLPISLPVKERWIVFWNPFYHFLNLILDPLMGKRFAMIDFGVVMLFTGVGFFIYFLFIKKYRKLVVFWL